MNSTPKITAEPLHLPNAEQVALGLRLLGVTRVEVCGSLIQARHHGQSVDIRLCRENIPFVCWTTEDGEEHIGYGFRTALKALDATGFVKPTTIITRALRSLGLSNDRLVRDFYVHGEYNTARERVRTIAPFRGEKAESTVAREWDNLKAALDLTGYDFRLEDCGGKYHYITN